MKDLVLFYSYTGHTKALAQEYAEKKSADIAEIRDIKRPGKMKAYTAGCFAAMRGKPWPIQPFETDIAAYDHIELFSPVWAGNPPPAVHAAIRLLPKGKTVSVTMVSASGKSGCRAAVEAAIQSKGCTPEAFEDVKSR